MKIVADTHTHTLACSHAYSTVTENCMEAARKGLRFMAMTEHAPAMPGSPAQVFFHNLKAVSPEIGGVVLLKGAELNIMDSKGNLDLSDKILERLDWVIASLHIPCFPPDTREAHTAAWLAVAENPLVDVIGHVGDGRYPFDEERVVKAFARHGKIVEINAHSFGTRPGSEENCPRIARLCAREGVPVVVSSDAHFHHEVGRFDKAVKVLEEIDFPEELILNGDERRFLKVVKEKAAEPLKAYLETI